MTIKKLPSQPSTQWHKLNELIDAHNTLEGRVEKLELVNPMVDFIGDAPGDRFDGSLAAIRKGLNNPEYTLALRGCYASIHEGRKELVIRPVDNEVDDTPQEKPSFREALEGKLANLMLMPQSLKRDLLDAICNLVEEYYGGESDE